MFVSGGVLLQKMSEFSEGILLAQASSSNVKELLRYKTQPEAPLDVDYEALPLTHKLWVHLTAGAIAGAGEHCVMFPVDSVKTRLQSLCPCPETNCPTPIHGVASIMRREGWLRPLRGVNAVAVGAVPAHALYFTVYEKVKVRAK